MRDLFEEDGRGQGVEGTGEAGEQGPDVDHDGWLVDRCVQKEGMSVCGFQVGMDGPTLAGLASVRTPRKRTEEEDRPAAY